MEEAKDLMYFLLPFGNDNDKAKGWGPHPPSFRNLGRERCLRGRAPSGTELSSWISRGLCRNVQSYLEWPFLALATLGINWRLLTYILHLDSGETQSTDDQ